MMMKKKLCRIRLINWHYFVNETINVKGSFLISGENTSGKSTVLDAIQLVLTTNTRRFNTAANEKSSRDLKGYVRCKTGNETGTYLRSGSVITYVALEFFEEKTGKYFTLGAKIDSPDEESKLTTKWFREECRLEELSFITEGRPSTAEEFRRNDKKINLITQLSEAKSRFGQRLGNLEDKFFDIIPKSLAFKPMDNVKEFINKFILPEKTIEVATLRNNIAALKELEDLMEITKAKINKLNSILSKNNEILAKERDIGINEVLIQKAEIEVKKIEHNELMEKYHILFQKLSDEEGNEKLVKEVLDNERVRQTNLQISLRNNETVQLIRDIKHNIDLFERDKQKAVENAQKLKGMLDYVTDALSSLGKLNIFVMTKENLDRLAGSAVSMEERTQLARSLENEFNRLLDSYRNKRYALSDKLEKFKTKKSVLEREIKDLKNRKLTYPENTTKLKAAIEKEFLAQGIDSEVRIFSDLLEITDPSWQNAVEGYLNSQRFYIIVEPRYYKTALDVYDRIKREVHTVGLVNTLKLDINAEIDVNSLAYVVKSENRWARAYSIYLLNRVIRCSNVHDLKDFKVAITADCMLYQNYAVRKIDDRIYNTPYIGTYAFEVQLKNKQSELEKLNEELIEAEAEYKECGLVIDKLDNCKFNILFDNLNAPEEVRRLDEVIDKEKAELEKAEANPTYIELQTQIEECEKAVKAEESKYRNCINRIADLKSKINSIKEDAERIKDLINNLDEKFNTFCDLNTEFALAGIEKYNEQLKVEPPAVILKNFLPQKVKLEDKKNKLCNEIYKLQVDYCTEYNCDLGTGYDQIQEYIDEYHKLEKSEIIKYEEDLKKAKENCHLEFRESFLARLKENIDSAKLEFKNLNNALKDIYYGEDSYKFELSHNKSKEKIYQMITSRNNIEGFNLFSSAFDDEYREEMEDLFSKLTAYDDKGEKVLAEYTDYRSYLDYDISVVKSDGSKQPLSKTLGEKSGGETQTPYYVAMAASFAQLYKMGDTIRIIMLDEAFDKMDDNRISAMMDFLNGQEFQIILAAPPSKIEIIGEKVDTILLAMREGTVSIIEEYDL